MENKKKKGLVTGMACGVIILLAAALLIVYNVAKPKATSNIKGITIEVIDDAGSSTYYNTNTEAEFLGQVFGEIDSLSVEGDSSEYGLFITTVNGLTADYNTDGAYWAIYVNGEYGKYGADSQPVADQDTYTLKYEVYAQ